MIITTVTTITITNERRPMCECCGRQGLPVIEELTVRLLREHILAEQNGVFPAALSHLDADDWDVIEHLRERVGTAVPNPVR